MIYPIIEIPADAPTQFEQLGTKAKFWYRDQGGRSMLFKEGRPGTGENWAEKVCCEICRHLDLPHAEYDFAVWKSKKGVVTPNFVPEGGRLVLGNELLAKIISNYGEGHRYQVRQHTVRAVMAVTSSKVIGTPLLWIAPTVIKDAAGVFVGYVMLDALVGNQDRHHENWGLVWLLDEGVFFAPTFDHASSLGRNETDPVRQQMLTTRDRGRSVETYVERAKSALFTSPADTRPLKTLEAFQEAAKIRPDAAAYWVTKLARLTLDDYRAILADVPDSEITAPARDFALKMLEINTQRILNLGSRF
ncbi:MAG: phosphatidylinositol kinase [Pseudomonadota bacterium]